jgi:hypothetical protein
MGKKFKHVSESAGTYWVPSAPGRLPPLPKVSKKQALKKARAAKVSKKQDPKQRGRAKQAKKSGGRKRK